MLDSLLAKGLDLTKALCGTYRTQNIGAALSVNSSMHTRAYPHVASRDLEHGTTGIWGTDLRSKPGIGSTVSVGIGAPFLWDSTHRSLGIWNTESAPSPGI